MGRRRGGRAPNVAVLRSVLAAELEKAMSGAPRTAANPTAQAAAMSSTPGGTFDQLAAMMRSMVGYQARPMARDPRDAGPFGPMHPMPPDAISPARTDSGRPEPWLYEYPVAWNIPGQGERLMPWRVLREAARNIDVIRRCIEIRKSRVKPAPWSWDISPQAIEDAYRKDRTKGHDDIAAELRDRYRADINRLTEFWRNPWRANGLDFGQWAGGVMEGRLKYDAAVLYPRYNLGGDTLLGFEIIDATTIKPLLDYRGARPEPPFPAFQQILYGFPRGEWRATVVEVRNDDGTTTHVAEGTFAADQLEYLRDNYIENTPYGYGPTEQALIAARLWMRRQGWMMAEYTDGVAPAMVWEVPLDATGGAQLTPQQRVEWEASVNDELSGQTGERHRSKVGFPGMTPHLLPSVDERYKPEYDLFLIKLLCSFFGVPASDLGFTETRGLGGSGMHASQAENRADISTDPDLLFMAALVDRLGHQHQGAPAELLFSFTSNDGGQDEQKAATIRAGEVNSGQKTMNDARRELSLPAYPFPEADMPFVMGQAGPVFIEGSLAASQRAQGLDANGKPLPVGQGPGEQGLPGGGPQGNTQGGDGAIANKAAPPLHRVIREQLAGDYPPESTAWIEGANWHGPVDVPPNRLDLDDVKSWDAYGDTRKVDKFRQLMQRPGALKPIVAVTVPGDDRVKVIDGHHRALAAVREGLPVRAYVGAVDAKVGPWTRMHAMQHAGDDSAAPTSGAGYVGKMADADWWKAWDPAKHPKGPDGRFVTVADRLEHAIREHHAGRGGNPLDGFNREQLRRVAKARGIELRRGASQDEIGRALLADIGHESPGAPRHEATVRAPKTRKPRAKPEVKFGPTGTRVRGTDRVGSLDYAAAMRDYRHDQPSTGDSALAHVLHEQGFDGKPRVVDETEFDRAVRAGEVSETWRGIGRHGGNGEAHAEQYRTGDLHPGWGINGNGTYVSAKREVAAMYGNAMVRIGLRKDAKVIDMEELDRMMDEWHAEHRTDSRAAADAEREMLARLAKLKSKRARAQLRADKRSALAFYESDPERSFMRDPGRFAAVLGYDAISIPQTYSPDKTPEMIILNRTATIVQRAARWS